MATARRSTRKVAEVFVPTLEVQGRITRYLGQDRVEAYLASQPDPWVALLDLAREAQTIAIEYRIMCGAR